MSTKITVRDVVDSLELLSDGVDFFLNTKSGEIRPVTEDDRFLLEDEQELEGSPPWQREAQALVREVFESEDWLQLPTARDIHEWSIMDSFSRAQPGQTRDELLDAIHGRGAFRAFRAAVARLGLRDAWFAHRRAALEEIARAWLDEHGLLLE